MFQQVLHNNCIAFVVFVCVLVGQMGVAPSMLVSNMFWCIFLVVQIPIGRWFCGFLSVCCDFDFFCFLRWSAIGRTKETCDFS